VCAIALVGCVTAACSGGQSDLQRWIAETKKKPGGRIQPLPEVKPYESFVYSASNLRSPFQPASPNLANGAGGYDNLTMDVTAKTYRYIDDEGPKPAAKKKTGGET
jgi:type IV pilus assembly protein PilP